VLWIDKKYAQMLSPRLEMFKVKRLEPYIANCRCPYCGDSHKNKHKARGYLVAKGQCILFFCHNCGVKTSLGKVLEYVDPRIYREWRIEQLKEEQPTKTVSDSDFSVEKVKEVFGRNPLHQLDAISGLPEDHPARVYANSRLIPLDAQKQLFWADNFAEWVNSLMPGKLPFSTEGRIVIPFFDDKRNLFGFQGRAINKTSMRYITIMLDQNMPKVFGLERLGEGDVWIVEGPLDSLFMPKNTIAMAGSDVDPERLIDKAKQRAIFVYDNEPRSAEILAKIEHRIADGYRVVIWPQSVSGIKDINDMIMSGILQKELQEMLVQNTYKGINAKLRLTEWRKRTKMRYINV
jgi:hypothetical protein